MDGTQRVVREDGLAPLGGRASFFHSRFMPLATPILGHRGLSADRQAEGHQIRRATAARALSPLACAQHLLEARTRSGLLLSPLCPRANSPRAAS